MYYIALQRVRRGIAYTGRTCGCIDRLRAANEPHLVSGIENREIDNEQAAVKRHITHP